MEKYRKTLAWILRDESFHFDKDREGFIPISQVIEEYDSYVMSKRAEISQQAHFCAYEFRPNRRHDYKILYECPKEMRDIFLPDYGYIMSDDEYNRLLANYLNKHVNFPDLTTAIILDVARQYSDQLLVKGNSIRPIRSWERL